VIVNHAQHVVIGTTPKCDGRPTPKNTSGDEDAYTQRVKIPPPRHNAHRVATFFRRK
jgi:hypothetical protein